MNSRVQRLRQESLDAIPSISDERALLLTRFYQQENGIRSYPVQRAMAY